MSMTPAPQALFKAARKHNTKRVVDVISPDVIEILLDDDGKA